MRYPLGVLWVAAAGIMAGAGEPAATQSTTRPTYAEAFKAYYDYAGPRTQETLDRLTRALERPETRMAAVRELVDFAGHEAYQVGSVFMVYPDGTRDIRRKAVAVLSAAMDEATIGLALSSEDPILVYWGLWQFGRLREPQIHVPRLKALAAGHDESLRARAVEVLGRHGQESRFLGQRVEEEKSPHVLANLLLSNTAAGVPARFNERIVALLKDADPDVRQAAVNFIGGNWTAAAMRQMFVDATVMEALLARADTPEAGIALATFRDRANQPDLTDFPTAAAWWKEHRRDWEQARFPRWVRPNGGSIVAAIVTKGEAPAWEALIELRNTGTQPVALDAGELARIDWQFFRQDGSRMPLEPRRDEVSRWIIIGPGEQVREPAGLKLPALQDGRYLLRGVVTFTGSRAEGRPAGMAVYSLQLPLPAIVVEIGT